MSNSTGNFFAQGGPFMVPLAVCSLVALTIILERAVALRRGRVINQRIETAIEMTPHERVAETVGNAAVHDDSSLGRLVSHALAQGDAPRHELHDAVQVRARAEVLRLERGIVGLEIITGIAPLLGLLGTVSGLVHIFAGIGGSTAQQGPAIAQGIAEALNTTIAGLVVAVPCLIFHSVYSRRVESLASELEGLLSEFISKLYAAGRPEAR
jgi:biopolymer transport protein ExbB